VANCFFLFVFFAPAFADYLCLKNGDKISGQIVLGSTKAVLFASTLTGIPVEISWGEADSMKSDQNQIVVLKTGEKIIGNLDYSNKAGLVIYSPKMGKIKVC